MNIDFCRLYFGVIRSPWDILNFFILWCRCMIDAIEYRACVNWLLTHAKNTGLWAVRGVNGRHLARTYFRHCQQRRQITCVTSVPKIALGLLGFIIRKFRGGDVTELVAWIIWGASFEFAQGCGSGGGEVGGLVGAVGLYELPACAILLEDDILVCLLLSTV